MTHLMDLRCGPLTMGFEQATGAVRYVRCGRTEVLRGIYAAVRDHNWDTVPSTLSNLELDTRDGGFLLTFDVTCQSQNVDFTWHGSIVGDATGRLTYQLEGIANTDFYRNRIGFCVLHPSESCKGQWCRVEKDDGSVEDAEFPLRISPHQPFTNMRAITHSVSPGLLAEVRFAGDVFEMEDQRNWTDASFKTYCTPLALPFPAKVSTGTRISQSVTLTLKGASVPLVGSTSRDPAPVTLDILSHRSHLPSIGLGVASHGQPLSPRQRDGLATLNLSHLRVDLAITDSDWQSKWARAATEAAAIGIPLEVAVQLGDSPDEDLARLAETYAARPVGVARWLVFDKAHHPVAPDVMSTAREVIASLVSEAGVGSGTDAYFAELNRQRPTSLDIDCLAYSINPQVHAFDDASLIETLPIQAETVRNARELVGDIPIVVGPVTLRPRFNPNATGPEAPLVPGELPPQVDPRQASQFAAAWTLGSLKHLAEAGVASVTFFETTGWRGVMDTETGSSDPEQFSSTPGSLFPLFHVFANLAPFRGGQVQAVRSSQPLSADAVMLARGQSRRMLVANFKSKPAQISISMPRENLRVTVTPLIAKFLEGTGTSASQLHGDSHHVARGYVDAEVAPHGVLRLDWTSVDGE